MNNIEIIYPEKDSMQKIAVVLENSLCNYRIPKAVRRKTGIKSLDDIEKKWLIVLCDPDATKDNNIKERILFYSRKGEYSQILSLLVSGGSKKSFPHELIFEEKPDGTIVEHEPLAANISSETIDQSLKKLKIEKLRLIAPMLGVSFDELNRRREKQLFQLAIGAGGFLVVFALVFLVFAAMRMRVIVTQNTSLESEYNIIESARIESEMERDEADKQYASLIATSARLALDNRDTELAMLLAMEVLPGAGEGGDAEAVLSDALDILSSKGYVPITTGNSYMRDRYYDENNLGEYETDFPQTISMRIPDGFISQGKPSFTLRKTLYSEEYGYALYKGYFEGANDQGESVGNIYLMRMCFFDDTLEDYYILMEDGTPADFSYTIVLPDGSIMGREYVVYTGYTYVHFDPFSRSFLDDIEGTSLENEVTTNELMIENGWDFFVSSHYSGSGDSYVYSFDTYDQLKVLDKVSRIYMYDTLSFLLGRTPTGIMVMDKNSLECLAMIEDEYSSPSPTILPFHHPEYGEFVVLKTNDYQAIYELPNGNRVLVLSTGTSNAYGRDSSLLWEVWDKVYSSEGYYAVGIGNSIEIYRIWDGTLYERIENIGDNASAEMFGPYDPVTGCRSASAIWVGNGIVYEYHETARQVPETLDERLALATELLNGRTLTDEERKTYGL